jgi:predicted dinucleotide-binding enzyme
MIKAGEGGGSFVTTVTILGAGNMARGIATRLLAASGNTIRILAPHAEHATGLAAQLAGDAGASVSGGGADEPLDGEVVVLAVWYDAAVEVAERRAGELAGKIVIDIANPVDVSTFDGLVTPPGTSAAEEVARRAPEARVVKAFNTTFAGTLVDGQVAGQQLGCCSPATTTTRRPGWQAWSRLQACGPSTPARSAEPASSSRPDSCT